MNVVVYSVTALSVAVLFYGWRAYQDTMKHRNKQLRERVTYMLWVMANNVAA
jgi:ABC-type thiamin/hydroxymethylpyrimidine transport system permease subunit